MMADLKQAYYRRLLPALVAIAAAAAVRGLDAAVDLPPVAVKVTGAVLFAGAVIAAVGLPIWIRTVFANRVRMQRNVDEMAFRKFQRRLIAAALIAPYLAAGALAIRLDAFYQGGAVLAALYGIYYHYPSQRRIDFDRRLFRVGKSQAC
ncbi:MAG: hypothetical protein V2L15_09760 [Desulfobacteraceae bacterium]|jgi:hypothetical protein|nr:hypothetical protein [Desulfobacteraceae bacterium]